jgi:lipopolysaccharide transport system permease protein
MIQAKPFRVRERVHLRDFVWTLIRTDFKARYHGALSGFVWALLKPVAMFAVLFAVFQFLFSDKAYLFYLLIGLLLWDFFNTATRCGMESLYEKGYLLLSTSFPRSVVVFTSLANSVLTLLLFCFSILAVLIFTHRAPGVLGLLLFLGYMLCYYLIVVGFSLASSVLFLKYRDLNQVWDVALQAGFFVAPIVYPLSTLPERLHVYLYVWPPTVIIQFSRMVLVDHKYPTLKAHALLVIATALSLAIGFFMFNKYSPKAVEKL